MKCKLALFVPVLALVFATGLDAQCCGNKAKAADAAACTAQECQAQGVAKATTSGTITTGALLALMHAKTPMTLIDARKEAKDPIPGAKTLCSKSMECTTYQAKTLGSKDRLIVAYCSGPKCPASTKMATKLRAAGYTNVVEFREGVAGWKALTAKSAGCSTCPSSTGKTAAKAGASCPSTGKTGDGCSASGTCPSASKTAKPATVLAQIDARGLHTLRAAKVPMVLIDARTGKWDDGVRIPGAIAIKNCSGACWSKPETFKNLVKDKNALVVTYCGIDKCPLSSIVATKLRAAGYTNVIEFKAGIADWKKQGFKTVGAEAGCCGGGDCPTDKDGKCSGSCGSKTEKTEKADNCSTAPAKKGCCGSKK